MRKRIKVGDKYKTKSCGDCVVVDHKDSRNITVRFVNTGYEAVVQAGNLRDGVVKDRLHPTVYGIGFIGKGEYRPSIDGKKTPAYKSWSAMLQRSYDQKFHARHPTYADCSVSKEWHNFQAFALWHMENYIEGYHLDKDLLVYGNKIYSKDTCVFVTPALNLLLRHKYLCALDTPDQAHTSWRIEKEKEIRRQAALSTTPLKLVQSLIGVANDLDMLIQNDLDIGYKHTQRISKTSLTQLIASRKIMPMEIKTQQLIDVFGSKAGIARFFGCTRQSVNTWGEDIPPLRAYHLKERRPDIYDAVTHDKSITA